MHGSRMTDVRPNPARGVALMPRIGRRRCGVSAKETSAFAVGVRRLNSGCTWLVRGLCGNLASLFTGDATYLQSPYEQPITGLDAIKRMWEEERDGPNEVFTLATDILVVDGPTAVVRAEVCYGDPPRQEYRDLWVIRLADDGRCTWFEEWPYWPERGHSACADLA